MVVLIGYFGRFAMKIFFINLEVYKKTASLTRIHFILNLSVVQLLKIFHEMKRTESP